MTNVKRSGSCDADPHPPTAAAIIQLRGTKKLTGISSTLADDTDISSKLQQLAGLTFLRELC